MHWKTYLEKNEKQRKEKKTYQVKKKNTQKP